MSKKDLVIDCSVSLAWYLEDEQSAFTDEVLNKLPHFNVWVPLIWRVEFTNAMMMAFKRKRISQSWLALGIDNANQRPFHYDDYIISMSELLELAQDYGLTAYDAIYLELAKRKKASIATLDKALIKAAKSAGIHLLN